ncbi:substrate-binding periplasmic protein [Zooshikella ganghwensis]|uniref:Amino acid ABC transporter substrate-binding protein n=1 Tax=Zooshikella ganghwensis TaxID=202772 RepID=A0A4P9VNU7_9GAMM|nr:transporter substrate-binding domain-containing protein [Zooshikella ganghwensis]RDH43652.1 amino acid ABC transporter substrate-binding protein [Zooshikella ganghwensis]
MRLLLLLFYYIFVSISEASDKLVKIATLHDYEPFCFSKEFGVEIIPPGKDSKYLKGYSWEIVRQSYHKMGYTIELNILPWPRALEFVKEGKVNLLFPAGKNSARQKIFHYSKEYVNEAKFLIYTLKNKSINWKGVKSLKGMNIAVKKDYNYGELFNDADYFNKISVNNISQGFKMLFANRVDGFAGYEKNWDYIISKEGNASNFKKYPYFGATYEYVVGNINDSLVIRLINVFDQGKRHIDFSGVTLKTQKEWFQNVDYM